MINDFRGQYRWLSNFHMAPVLFDGDMYPSSEHAYQAAKVHRKDRGPYLEIGVTAAQAKRLGRVLPLREDWEEVKLSVMTLILIDKFSRHPDLLESLLGTGDQELVEGNYWHDNFWGTCTCTKCGNRGKNNLGKVLMQIRKALNEDNTQE